MKRLRLCLALFGFLGLLTGVVYPLAIWGIGNLFWPSKAQGSLIKNSQGTIVGSELIGQKFESTGYFWGRPSSSNYDPMNSGGSNWGPTSSEFRSQVEARELALRRSHPEESSGRLPIYLLFASGSGLDPHIPPEAARYQLARVAKERRLSQKQIYDLNRTIESLVEAQPLRVFGELGVNVLLLNLALDEIASKSY